MRRIPVDVRCAHLHPHGRRGIDRADGRAQHASRFHSRTENFILVVGGLDAIDASSCQVDQPDRTVQFPAPSPRVRASQLTCLQGPLGFGGCRESSTIDLPDAAKCVAREIPKKPLPPAITIGPILASPDIELASAASRQTSLSLIQQSPAEHVEQAPNNQPNCVAMDFPAT